MCQATVYLARDGQEEEIMRDVILLEPTADGVRLSTFFEEPQMVRARIGRIDFLKHTVILVVENETGVFHCRLEGNPCKGLGNQASAARSSPPARGPTWLCWW